MALVALIPTAYLCYLYYITEDVPRIHIQPQDSIVDDIRLSELCRGANSDNNEWVDEGRDVLTDVVPSSAIEQYMQSHINELQEPFSPSHDEALYGLHLDNITLSAYRAELLSTLETYLFPPSPTPLPFAFLPALLSRLSLKPPLSPLPPRPNRVITTEKTIDHLPVEFNRWKEIMPDWTIGYFDDAGLLGWVGKWFGGTRGEAIWQNLPRQVLKTDVFRYMIMLVEGGIYTDSDTAPIIHADDWGYPYTDLTPPLLSHLSRLLSVSTSFAFPKSHPSSTFSIFLHADVYEQAKVDDGSELGKPSLIISIESDAIDFGWLDWRERKMARAVQMTQWTFMARPGHPVFLDALGRTLRKSEEFERREKEEGFIPESALEWTGPGVFSDCVYRYLLVRYGVRPEELVGTKSPVRIGDVLILPPGSYSSVSPFEEAEQRPWAASWHGFYGRWRTEDPAVIESERLQSVKEGQEEQAEQDKETGGAND
ncbi:hypothetical protein P7C73_g3907, partial [Tremellales sp. Uapishka_1]